MNFHRYYKMGSFFKYTNSLIRKQYGLCQLYQKNIPTLQQSRSHSAAYDSDGKTVARILNKKDIALKKFLISSYTEEGFGLVSGSYTYGPTILFPSHVLSWNISGDEMVNEESLMLFFHLHPKPDLVIIGIGNPANMPLVNERVRKLVNKYGVIIELLLTPQAVGQYNFLVIEDRHVAGAFIPPLVVEMGTKDILEYKIRHDLLYGRKVRDGEVWN